MKTRFMICVLVLALPVAAIAQTEIENPLQLNEGMLAAIFAAFGMGLFGIIAQIKKVFKTDKMTKNARNLAGYVISFAASAGCTIAVLASMQKFTIPRLILYTIGVWFEASGIWKGVKEAIQQHR